MTAERKQQTSAEKRGSPFDYRGCDDPMKYYPPFACYPVMDLPRNSAVLTNGVLLRKTRDTWWRSGIRNVDQTFTAPHFYKEDWKKNRPCFEIADEEYKELFRPHFVKPEQRQSSLMGMAF